MTDFTTGAGATFSLSATAPGTYNQAGYEALTFTEVGKVTDFGQIPSRVYQVVSLQYIASSRAPTRPRAAMISVTRPLRLRLMLPTLARRFSARRPTAHRPIRSSWTTRRSARSMPVRWCLVGRRPGATTTPRQRSRSPSNTRWPAFRMTASSLSPDPVQPVS
jgi:hypothetical protein